MAAVNVVGVRVVDSVGTFSDPMKFQIEYECLCALQDDLVWRLTYVGSAESEEYDQVLDEVAVGPILPGRFSFILEANPPDHQKIPADDLVSVTVVLLDCLYKGRIFIRVGYYVNTEYGEEALREAPPNPPQLDRLTRSILADQPRVTRFQIEFDEPAPVAAAADGQQFGADPAAAAGGVDGGAQQMDMT